MLITEVVLVLNIRNPTVFNQHLPKVCIITEFVSVKYFVYLTLGTSEW